MKILSLYQIYLKIKDIRIRCFKKIVAFLSLYGRPNETRTENGGRGEGGAFFASIFIPHTICQPCSLLKTSTFKINFSASPGITKSPSEYVNVFHDGIDL